MEKVIELNNRTRLVVTPDPAPRDVRDADTCITGCYTPPSWWGHRTEGPAPLFDHPGNIVLADNKLDAPDSWLPERNVQRWSWSFYGLELQRFGATYWYCDENQFNLLHGGPFTRAAQREVIEQEHTLYEHYRTGESKIVTLQRLAHFRRATKKYHEHHQDLLEVWENVASSHDVYLDAENTAFTVAFEDFYTYLSKKELTIITAAIDESRVERAL